MKEKIDWNLLEVVDIEGLIHCYRREDTKFNVILTARVLSKLFEYLELDMREFEEVQDWMHSMHRSYLRDLNDCRQKDKEKEK